MTSLEHERDTGKRPSPELVAALTDAVQRRGGRREGCEWRLPCPEPAKHRNGDANPSARWNPDKAVWRCDACGMGGGALDLAHRLGLELPRAMPRATRSTPRRKRATVQPAEGCTLAAYAAVKRLPETFLRELGLRDVVSQGAPALRIPYRDPAGTELAVRYRVGLDKSPEGDQRFRWRSGAKLVPYGLWRLEHARHAGMLVLVEGESDCHTLWHHGVPALGVPGASTWRPDWARNLDGIPTVYLVVEPDTGGPTLRARVAASGVADRLRLIELGDAKDPSGLYLRDPGDFARAWAAAVAAARPLAAVLAEERARVVAATWEQCAALAREPDILGVLVQDLARFGAVGEERAAKLVYLATTSRLLDRPVSLALKGPSAAGKSFTLEKVLGLFPASAYYALTAMSEHALAYSTEPLAHRMLVLYEAAGLGSEIAAYLVRSLLSEGRVRYETVEKTSEGFQARLFERPGPTGLLLSTTALRLHPENETRLLSVPVDDTQEQTRRVFRALAARPEATPQDLGRWHALQGWLEAAEHRVAIPFADALAAAFPPVAVRLRRDFKLLLDLIEAHALLHQATRARDDAGQVVATRADYAVVRDLVHDLLGAAVQASAPATTRETVEAVAALLTGDAGEVTVPAIAERLRLDRTAAYRRAKAAEVAGYLRNLQDRRGKPARYVLGDPLPAERELLPPPERLGCTVAAASEGVDHAQTPPVGRERFRVA